MENNIIVALDFSPASEILIQKAIEFAKGSSGKLFLVHVMPVDIGVIIGDAGFEFPYAQLQEPPEEAGKIELQKWVDMCTEQGVDAEGVLKTGIPVEEILAAIDELLANWIMLASHGHGALYEAIVGSVAHDVIKDSKIPVIVIPKQK